MAPGGTSFTVALTAPRARPGVSARTHNRHSRNVVESRTASSRVSFAEKRHVGLKVKRPPHGAQNGNKTENVAFDPGGGGDGSGAGEDLVPRRPRIRPAPPPLKPEPKILRPKGKVSKKEHEPVGEYF